MGYAYRGGLDALSLSLSLLRLIALCLTVCRARREQVGARGLCVAKIVCVGAAQQQLVCRAFFVLHTVRERENGPENLAEICAPLSSLPRSRTVISTMCVYVCVERITYIAKPQCGVLLALLLLALALLREEAREEIGEERKRERGNVGGTLRVRGVREEAIGGGIRKRLA